jgi:flagellar motor switch protein FliG
MTTASQADDREFRQAAILLRAIGDDQAARAATRLWPRDARRLGSAMAALGRVSARQTDTVVGAFLEALGNATHYGSGAGEYLQNLIDGSGTALRPRARRDAEAIRRQRGAPGPQWLSLAAVVRLVRSQAPNLRAMTLAYLEPARAAAVIDALAPEERTALLVQLAAVPGSLWAARERRSPGDRPERLGGWPAVAAIVRHLCAEAREDVVAAIGAVDAELAAYLSG